MLEEPNTRGECTPIHRTVPALRMYRYSDRRDVQPLRCDRDMNASFDRCCTAVRCVTLNCFWYCFNMMERRQQCKSAQKKRQQSLLLSASARFNRCIRMPTLRVTACRRCNSYRKRAQMHWTVHAVCMLLLAVPTSYICLLLGESSACTPLLGVYTLS